MEHLPERQLLLILDNFEHVVSAAPVVSALLAFCPELKVLVTSRRSLHLSEETTFPLPPLNIPDPQTASVDELAGYDAIALFVERARAAKSDFELTSAPLLLA
jgi:predicted ATPase